MEAIVLKATLTKRREQEKQQAAGERKKWQESAGVKTVKASEPEGGW